MAVSGLLLAAQMPIRQAYLNDMIPSQQRAGRVLSFDSLMGSSGGVVIQPALGRVADVASYGTSFLVAGGLQLLAVPFLLLSRRERADADTASDRWPELLPRRRSAADEEGAVSNAWGAGGGTGRRCRPSRRGRPSPRAVVTTRSSPPGTTPAPRS
jgi:MFS family permease